MSPSEEPFDEKRYKALMDGLECSIVCLSHINTDNEKFRFDSDFYQKKYIDAYQNIKSIPHSSINDELEVLTDFHANGSYENIARFFKLLDEPDYAYMVRTTDLEKKDYMRNVKYVTKQAYESLAKSKLFGGEVIINKIGSPGRTFLMPYLDKPVSLGMNLFMLRMKKNCKIDNTTLYIFLNSSIGKLLIERKINGTVPLTIDKEAVRSIYIPCFSEGFRKELIMVVEMANNLFCNSDRLYSSLEEKLLGLILFDRSMIPTNGCTQKTLYESFGTSGRIDAEYYQPKYDILFDALCKHHCEKLGGNNGLVTIMKSIEPGSDAYQEEGIPFIRVSDVDRFGISKTSIKLSPNIVPTVESLFPSKDTILLSKDGSVGLAYKLEESMQVITSSALLHLTVKDTEKILPDYLTLVLNSPIVQLQAERDVNSAVIPHWKPSEIENVLIPILDMDTQKEIAAKVQESFALRKESKRLLDLAVKVVETAIETDETTALQLLEQN